MIKKIFIGYALAMFLLFTGCKKNAASAGIGQWTFKGTTYYATTAQGTGYVLTASDANSVNIGQQNGISFSFSGNSMPSGSGSYKIAGPYGGSSGNWVTISVGILGGIPNEWTSTGRDSAYANVTVSTSGKVTVAVSSAEVLNGATGDSSAVTGVNIIEQ